MVLEPFMTWEDVDSTKVRYCKCYFFFVILYDQPKGDGFFDITILVKCSVGIVNRDGAR